MLFAFLQGLTPAEVYNVGKSETCTHFVVSLGFGRGFFPLEPERRPKKHTHTHTHPFTHTRARGHTHMCARTHITQNCSSNREEAQAEFFRKNENYSFGGKKAKK